ncbi:protein WHAT'S THIS FACTOR 9, mitochondrial-like [Raphanus sativus]|uniref:Protein WHAT'S THIS FACTOR 9, mitochondrial-like n=1 Tax=Raphanus sativus TaxID=3726 RepID=A0A9W3CI99_RAPSA|nr:protein WHAT'S THIS FACTOR 9, mitochondrial-like [Raphanus sativus]
MKSIFRTVPLRRQTNRRAFTDAAEETYKFVRDRGLDHAVEREKNLRPLLSIKDLVTSEPSKSLPISVITSRKDSLRVPLRPIEFIRSFPSVFHESLPGGIQPQISLTPETLNLDAEEQLVYASEEYKQGLADRLLKLLMINRINKIPLEILELLKWDLGLPRGYAETVVPEFPDYFRVCRGELELVCWSKEHAVSVLEKKAKEYTKGAPIAFPMKFSNGFVVDKKMKRWIDDWQKLPYISPYENALHLSATSDESDKWAAAVLHEILNLFVSKKVEKDLVLHLGEFMGLRSRFKRVLHNHPGVFYLSSKLRTHTVVLRDGYKRGVLVEGNQLVTSRNRYMKLMSKVKKENSAVSSRKREDKGKVEGGEVCETEAKGEGDDVSGSEVEDEREEDVVVDEDEDDDVVDDDEDQSMKRGRRNSSPRAGRRSFGSQEKPHTRSRAGRRSFGKSGSQEKPRSGRRNKVNLTTEKSS